MIESKKINRLVFFTSETCNLNCTYCAIAKSAIKEYSLEETEKIKKSLISGEYVDNMVKAINKLHANPKNITGVDLWGQEPTLTLKEFASTFPYLYSKFSNIEKIFFSTNAISNMDNILNLIKTVEKTVEKKFEIHIQFSYDGYEFTKKSRGIEPNIILNNIKYLIKSLNKINLNNTYIRMMFHNVLSREIMKSYTTEEEIKKYWKELDNTVSLLRKINKNINVDIPKTVHPGIENPVDATKEEGEIFANFVKHSINLKDEINSNILNNFLDQRNGLNYLNKSIDDILEEMSEEGLDFNLNKKISQSLSCNPQSFALKMRYNGQLIHCQNVIFKTKKEHFEKMNNSDNNIYHKILSENNYYVNLLTDKEEDIEKVFNKYKILSECSFYHFFCEILSLMVYLAEANLIDTSYKYNDYKIMRHAFIMTHIINCLDNNIKETGSILGKSAEQIKFYCNGVLDYIDDLVYAEPFKEKRRKN